MLGVWRSHRVAVGLGFFCVCVTCVTWMHRRVVLWDRELMHFQAYVYTIFVYSVVYVDMSTHSSQINLLSLVGLVPWRE